MRTFLVLAAIVAVAAAEVSLHAVLQAKWGNFKATHSKTYHRDEEPKRVRAFLANALTVETHNEKFAKGQASFEVAHNEFSDMTYEEFKATMLGFKPSAMLRSAHDNVTEFAAKPGLEMPGHCDWRPYSRTVKNQGQCGSCYSFAAMGALSAALTRRTGYEHDLSEQNIVDCSAGYGNGGCDGGLMTNTFEYVRRNGGVNFAADYPYEEAVRTCRYSAKKTRATLSSYARVQSGSDLALEQALATIGPVSVAVDVPRAFMMYSRGVFDDTSCSPTRLSHAVLAVGYGIENGKPYFLVKNSWGTSWGEAGYIKIAKGKNMCGISTDACYPII